MKILLGIMCFKMQAKMIKQHLVYQKYIWSLKYTRCWFNLYGQDQTQPPAVRMLDDTAEDKIKNAFFPSCEETCQSCH